MTNGEAASILAEHLKYDIPSHRRQLELALMMGIGALKGIDQVLNQMEGLLARPQDFYKEVKVPGSRGRAEVSSGGS